MKNSTKKLEYFLPDTAFARKTRIDRSKDKMMVGYPDGRTLDSKVEDMRRFLNPGDTIIFNDSKTINGIVKGFNTEYGELNFHIISFSDKDIVCSISIREDLRQEIIGKKFKISENLKFTIIKHEKTSHYLVKSNLEVPVLLSELTVIGEPIVSNYVTGDLSLENYQNNVSKTIGSLENPVASSHLTEELLLDLKSHGVNIGYLTLHCVSNSAFISEENYLDHKVPTEWFSIPEQTAKLIKKTKENNNKIIAIGTTVARTLESLEYKQNYTINSDLTGVTSLGIFPGYKFKVVDAILTNFHGSRSSRLGLAAAFIGENEIIDLYNESIEKNYKFFEFGDCTLLFNKN